jgi:Peptidase A4 family
VATIGRNRSRIAVGAVVVVLALAFAVSAGADTATDVNWAGYTVTGGSVSYTSVTATWRAPVVTCAAADTGNQAAFWVGLGGLAANSALEQAGTSADCDATTGKPTYYAWYELLPQPPVTIKTVKIFPGDLVTASVNVIGGTTVEFQVKNRTRKTAFTTKLTYSTPDTSSADWIAEAPSLCNQFRCRTVPLANFGAVAFTNVAALGNGIGGTLTANPGWTATAITLSPLSRRGYYPAQDIFAGTTTASGSAAPSAPSTDGRGFNIQWLANGS